MKLRVRLAKENIFLSNLEFVKAVTRALRRSELPLKYSRGFHPRVKLSAGPALALGIESQFEYVDIALSEKIDPADVIDRLRNNFPEGIKALEAEEISPLSPPLTQERHLIIYRFSSISENCLKNFNELSSTGIGFVKKKGKLINVMDYIKEIKIFEARNIVEIAIEIGPEGGLNPVALLREIGGLGKEELPQVRIEKIGFKKV